MEGKHAAPFWSAGIVTLNYLYVGDFIRNHSCVEHCDVIFYGKCLMASALVSFLVLYMNRCLVFTPGNPSIIFPPLTVPYMVLLRRLSCLCCFLTCSRGILKTPRRPLVGLMVMGLQGHTHLMLSGIVHSLFVL